MPSIMRASKSPLCSLGPGPPQRASALVAGSRAHGAPSGRHRPARRDCASSAAAQSVPARIERHGAPGTLLPGPALDRDRVATPPDPRPPAPRGTHRRRQPPPRPPRELLHSEPPLSSPRTDQKSETLAGRASRAFGLRSALRNQTSCRSRTRPSHEARVARSRAPTRSRWRPGPGHSCFYLAAPLRGAVPSSLALLGEASVSFLRARGLGNGGEPASAQPAPVPVQKNPGAPRASSLRGFKQPARRDPLCTESGSRDPERCSWGGEVLGRSTRCLVVGRSWGDGYVGSYLEVGGDRRRGDGYWLGYSGGLPRSRGIPSSTTRAAWRACRC